MLLGYSKCLMTSTYNHNTIDIVVDINNGYCIILQEYLNAMHN